MQNQKYRFIQKIGQGTFADVIKAENTSTQEIVAIKRIKQQYLSVKQILQIREIQVLKKVKECPFITQLKEIIYDQKQGRLSLVFELLNASLEIFMSVPIPEQQVKWYFYQCLVATNSLQNQGFFHRDIKPENFMLLRPKTDGCTWLSDIIKLGDFGAARPLEGDQPFTEYVATRWYRAPEAILSCGIYGKELDSFALGCLLFEMLTGKALFDGDTELQQLEKIHKILGTPSKKLLKAMQGSSPNKEVTTKFSEFRTTSLRTLTDVKLSDKAVDLIEKLIAYDPKQRFSITSALKHEFFSDIQELINRSRAESGVDEHYLNFLVNSTQSVYEEARVLLQHSTLCSLQKHVNAELPTLRQSEVKSQVGKAVETPLLLPMINKLNNASNQMK